MIRVVHISSARVWRGAEQQVHLLLQANTPAVSNYLFCPNGAALAEKNAMIKDQVGTYSKSFGLDIAGGFRLMRFIKQHTIQLAHIHDSHALNLYWVAYWLGARIPAVYHKHHVHPVKNGFKYDRDPIRKIICVSDAVYTVAAQAIDKNKLRIIYPGIPAEENITVSSTLKNELEIPDTAILVGMVAALEKEKNIDAFLLIAGRVIQKKGDVYFVLIGSGTQEAEIRNAIQNAGLENRVKLTGFRNDVPALLKQLDLFLFTSLAEGFPLAVLEAMQAGVPVVSSDSGGLQEMVLDGKTGLVYHAAADAGEKIIRLLGDETEKKRLKEQAAAFVREFSTGNMIQKTHTLYTEIIA